MFYHQKLLRKCYLSLYNQQKLKFYSFFFGTKGSKFRGMDTAHKTDYEKQEIFDTPEELDRKIDLLAQMIKSSEYFVAFTGAGLSTGAGIKDFRSGVNTVLPTGPGAWEKLATKDNSKAKVNVPLLKALPTPSHMALVKLEQEGHLKFLISQNVDGLHRRSGFPSWKLAELHGNTNLEVCKNKKCEKKYLRDYRVRTAQSVHDHLTGNKCDNCGSPLYDSIINFKEPLPEEELLAGFANSEKADLCLVLGSSLRVNPAAEMPLQTFVNGGKLVIVNLQPTPLDGQSLRINGLIDDVMSRLMKKLDLDIPNFILKRRLAIKLIDNQSTGKQGLAFRGLDADNSVYSLFTEIIVNLPQQKEKYKITKEPFVVFPNKTKLDAKEIAKIKLKFRANYGEPDLDMDLPIGLLSKDQEFIFTMDYDPKKGKWINIAEGYI